MSSRRYNNPNHPPIPSSSISNTTSLSYSQHGSRSHRDSRPTARKYICPDPILLEQFRGRGGRTLSPIFFTYEGSRGGNTGVRMLDAQHKVNIIENARHQISPGAPDYTRISLRILWPGYEPADCTINLEDDLTIEKLARQVAGHYSNFIEKRKHFVCKSPGWKVGHDGILFNSLSLLSLVNVSRNIWIAEVESETPRR